MMSQSNAEESPLLLVGLGNPGQKYEATRHNAGFMALDDIIDSYGLEGPVSKYKGDWYTGTIAGRKLFALKPQTFMNDSGISVSEAVRFFKIPLENVIVFYDELDLPVGKIRTKKGGGAGGHNGIRSIDSHIGKDYRRVRIGIDHPGHKDAVHGYVLKPFPKQDRAVVDQLIAHLSDHLDILIGGQAEHYMSKVALAMQPPKPKQEANEEKPEKEKEA